MHGQNKNIMLLSVSYFRSILLLYALVIPLRGQISADFSAGQEGDPAGAYADAAGEGWNTTWLTKSNFGGPILRNVLSVSPLSGGGNYLQVSAIQRGGGGNVRSFIGIARQFAGSPARGVDRTHAHVISFDFRLDECSGFDTADDTFTIGDATDTTTTSGMGSTSNFIIRAFGAGSGKAGAGNWALYNGNKKGTWLDPKAFVNTGMALRIGVIYSFVIRLNSQDKTYTVTINGDGKSYVSPAMGYRTQGFGNGVLAFMREGHSGDYTSFSLDNISITPALNILSDPRPGQLDELAKVVAKSTTVSLDDSVVYQRFAGFGVSSAWHESEFGKDGGKLFNELFDNAGMALDFLRVANDFSKENVSSADLKSADIIKRFKAMRPSGKVLMSSWSPPKELKTTKNLMATRKVGGMLDAALLDWECYKLSRWWVDSLKYFDVQGALPDYISIQNEPDFLNQGWPTCIIKPKLYIETLDWVTKELNWNGWAYKLFVVGPETSSLAAFSDYKKVLNTSQLKAYAVHSYDHPSDEQWQDFRMANNDKPVFMTEYDGETDLIGSASDIQRALVHGQVSAYFSWSVVNFPKDPPETGLFDASSGAKQQKYYALSHFSRWIQRDDTRIKAVSSTGDVLAVAFRRPNNTGKTYRYSIVLINKSSFPQEVLIDSENLKEKSAKAFVTSYAEGRYLQPTALPTSAKPHIEVPAQSVATVLINW